MHLLCLHGQGTNSEIFSTQTVSLRYELGDAHTYEFLEGVEPAPLAEELKTYFPSSTRTWNYFDAQDISSMRRALDQLHAFISLEGPFDGVVAYSHGAAFAATYILQQALANPSAPPPFKCAVFFSAGRPADPIALQEGKFRLLDPRVDSVRMNIPTTHIWGSNDTLHPGTWEFARELSVADMREHVVHQEGHDIPGGKARGAVLDIAKSVRRTVARAEEGWSARTG